VLSWLRGGCRGIVLIDWLHAGRTVDGVTTIYCAPSIAQKVYVATRKCWPLPKIKIPESVVRHAA